jgi:hypothetical protein
VSSILRIPASTGKPSSAALAEQEVRVRRDTRRAISSGRSHAPGRGLAAGDLDNDGRVDLVLLGHNEPLASFHNRSKGGHFVTIDLRGKGPRSNRDAIGARVTVSAGGKKLVSWRVGGASYQSAGDPRLHFGLGSAARIETVEVAWPLGHVDRHRDLPADAGYLLREGAERPERLPGFAPTGPH